MKEITRTHGKSTISVDKNKIVLRLGGEVSGNSLSALLTIIDEVVDKIGRDETWHGKFSFSRGKITLETYNDKLDACAWRWGIDE